MTTVVAGLAGGLLVGALGRSIAPQGTLRANLKGDTAVLVDLLLGIVTRFIA